MGPTIEANPRLADPIDTKMARPHLAPQPDLLALRRRDWLPLGTQGKGATVWRKSLFIAAAILLPAGALVGVTPGLAGATPPAAVGSVTCLIAGGSGSVHPGISPAGSIGGVKISFSGELTTCTSSVTFPTGVAVTGGSFKGSGDFEAPTSTSNGSSCANFDGSDPVGKIKVKITWTTVGPAIARTTVTYTSEPGPIAVTGPTNGSDTIRLENPYGVLSAGSSFSPPQPDTVLFGTNLPAPGTGCVGTHTTFTIPGGGVTFG